MSKATTQLNKIIKKLEKQLDVSIAKKEMQALGEFTLSIIVKRTRLGYGVKTNLGAKKRLLPLSDRYKKFRRTFTNLSDTTAPSKSNLTLTGQMLESMSVERVEPGSLVIRPTGSGRGRPSNIKIAQYQAEQGRIFNNLSKLEYQQVLRYYRKRFGDLLGKSSLLR